MAAESKGPDLYTRITNRIVADLEKGVRPWLRPWSGGNTAGRIIRPLRHNGEPYRGINIINLWCEADERGYSNPYWMTFKQALELGACVRKGEKASLVVFASRITRNETNSKGEETERDIPFLKSYSVFSAEQIEGLPARYTEFETQPLSPMQRDAEAEAWFSALGADVRHGGNKAYYVPSKDFIQLPPFETFRDPESYYAIRAHESAHWSGQESRLNRDLKNRFGDDGYAAEELIAELSAAFLSADLGITPEPREDHAAYLDSWLKVLRADKRAIFTAAAHADRAASYLHSLQPQSESEAMAA